MSIGARERLCYRDFLKLHQPYLFHLRQHTCASQDLALLSIKTKSRNRLNAQANMCDAISKKVPRFEKLTSKKQEQKSQ